MSRAVLLRGVDAFTLVPVRMLFAILTLGVILMVSERFRTLDPEAWKRGLILGTVSMALPMTLMTLGLEDLPVSLGGLLVALIPIATIAAAHFLVAGERFQVRALPGLLVALAGSGLLVGIGGASIAGVGDLWRGVGFTLSGVAMAGIGGAFARRFALQMSSDKLVLPQFSVNTVTVFLIAPFLTNTDLGGIEGSTWLLMAAVGAVGTALPFISFLLGASVNPASRLALTGYAVPVVAVALAVVFLGESLTPEILGGAVLILTGVILAERSTPAHVPEPGVFEPR
jgi:drug/metabolite transporter (DMT)-like permease